MLVITRVFLLFGMILTFGWDWLVCLKIHKARMFNTNMPVGPNHFTSLLDCSDGPLIILCTLIFHFFGYHLVRLSTWYLIKTDSENIYTLNQKIIALILYFSHAHHHKVQMIIRGMSGYVYFFNVALTKIIRKF